MIMVFADAVGIGIMIQILGGFLTSYYQGLNIIVMGMLVVIPFAFRESLILYALTWAIYAVPSFGKVLAGQDPLIVDGRAVELWRFVVNNLFFLTSIIFVGAFGSKIMDSIRRRELRNRIELEGTTAQLQESNIKLKSLDELKTQFFANVNHELRTPLTLMLAPLKAILEGRMGKLTPALKDTLETIQRNGYKLLKLINNLLDLSKLEEGKMRLKLKVVNLVDFIPPILASVKPMADQRQIRLYYQHPPHSVEVTLDPDQFEKVLFNLLSNALKFTNKGGKITVYVEEKDRTVMMTVEDTGIGIPANMLETIFDRFSQVDGSKSRAQEGTGIGLALAKEIVLVHKGTIRAESELGRGSRFIVEMLKGEDHFDDEVLDRRAEDLPVALRRRLTDTEEPRVQDIVTDFRRLQLVDLEKVDIEGGRVDQAKVHDALILCIDDNPEVLKLMKMLLADEFDLELMISAEQGIRFVREKTPDLVLCDVMMPGMDGHSFCQGDQDGRVHQAHPHHPGHRPDRGRDAGRGDRGRRRRLHLQAVRLDRAQGPHPGPAPHPPDGIGAGPGQQEPPDEDVGSRRTAAVPVPVDGQVPGLGHRRQGRIHPPPFDPGHRFLAEDRPPRWASARRSSATSSWPRSSTTSARSPFPESILNKPGKLTPEEFTLIKEHPVRGEAILSPVVELKEISRVVRAHHERYDGTGYPDRLKGREIPLGARIMAIADTYDSITSERPYRKAASHRYAVKEIIACSGAQFDPEVVQTFLEIAGTFVQDQDKDKEA